jgi:hypothetical protein
MPDEDKMFCNTCFHWTKPPSGATAGTCRRYPPTVISQGGGIAWPRTVEGDWCGEYRYVIDSGPK